MSGIIKPNNPFFNAMGKIGDLILLNVIFILSCVPVVTIGAALSALHISTDKISRNIESHVMRDFFLAFRENFKNSTVMWLILAAAGSLIYASARYIASGSGVLYIPFIFVLTLYIFILIYAFALQAEFVNTAPRILLNSLLTAVSNLPQTILLVLVICLPACVTFMLPEIIYATFMYWVLIGFSLSAFIADFIYRAVFKRYK